MATRPDKGVTVTLDDLPDEYKQKKREDALLVQQIMAANPTVSTH